MNVSSRLILIVVLFTAVFFYSETILASKNRTQLTNNDFGDIFPQISGLNVAWVGANCDDSGVFADCDDSEIYFYDGASVKRLTTNKYQDADPAISGSNVVWSGWDGNDFEIYLHDGVTTKQLTNNSHDDTDPSISGLNIVWMGWGGNTPDIYYYDGTSTQQITDNTNWQMLPQISGSNIVWTEVVPNLNTFASEAMFFDGTSVKQLTKNCSNTVAPRIKISGENIVWNCGNDDTGFDYFLFDGTSTKQLANNCRDIDHGEPQVSAESVTWGCEVGKFFQIFLYDGKTTRQLTNNSSDDYYLRWPVTSTTSVAWVALNIDSLDQQNSKYSIILFDGTSTNLVMTGLGTRRSPSMNISEQGLVWDGWDGTDMEIYMKKGLGMSSGSSSLWQMMIPVITKGTD